jgi:hypothetical protein
MPSQPVSSFDIEPSQRDCVSSVCPNLSMTAGVAEPEAVVRLAVAATPADAAVHDRDRQVRADVSPLRPSTACQSVPIVRPSNVPEAAVACVDALRRVPGLRLRTLDVDAVAFAVGRGERGREHDRARPAAGVSVIELISIGRVTDAPSTSSRIETTRPGVQLVPVGARDRVRREDDVESEIVPSRPLPDPFKNSFMTRGIASSASCISSFIACPTTRRCPRDGLQPLRDLHRVGDRRERDERLLGADVAGDVQRARLATAPVPCLTLRMIGTRTPCRRSSCGRCCA